MKFVGYILFVLILTICRSYVKNRYGEPEKGGSEWEPIKILLEGDRYFNKMNRASNTRLRLTTQVCQAHVATGVPLDLEQGPKNTPRKPPREGSENHHQEQPGTTQQSLEEPRRILNTYQGSSYKV
jgi:hypothetical protein